MENYKADYISPYTFEKTEIETKIPDSLVKQIQLDLTNLKDYLVTPTLINPVDMDSVVFGLMDMNDRTMKYMVTISPKHH